MDHSVEVTSGLLNLFTHLIVAVEVEDICDEVEGVLVVVDFGVETSQVESVGEVFLVDLAEVLVTTGRDELGTESVESWVSTIYCWRMKLQQVRSKWHTQTSRTGWKGCRFAQGLGHRPQRRHSVLGTYQEILAQDAWLRLVDTNFCRVRKRVE